LDPLAMAEPTPKMVIENKQAAAAINLVVFIALLPSYFFTV